MTCINRRGRDRDRSRVTEAKREVRPRARRVREAAPKAKIAERTISFLQRKRLPMGWFDLHQPESNSLRMSPRPATKVPEPFPAAMSPMLRLLESHGASAAARDPGSNRERDRRPEDRRIEIFSARSPPRSTLKFGLARIRLTGALRHVDP